MNCHITLLDKWKFKSHLDVLDNNCDIIKFYVAHYHISMYISHQLREYSN